MSPRRNYNRPVPDDYEAPRRYAAFHLAWESIFDYLPDKEAASLTRAILKYVKHGTIPKFEGLLGAQFYSFKEQIDRDLEANRIANFRRELRDNHNKEREEKRKEKKDKELENNDTEMGDNRGKGKSENESEKERESQSEILKENQSKDDDGLLKESLTKDNDFEKRAKLYPTISADKLKMVIVSDYCRDHGYSIDAEKAFNALQQKLAKGETISNWCAYLDACARNEKSNVDVTQEEEPEVPEWQRRKTVTYSELRGWYKGVKTEEEWQAALPLIIEAQESDGYTIVNDEVK